MALNKSCSCPNIGRCQTLPSLQSRLVSLGNVLFATDFSSSEAALPYGIGICRRYDATLYTVSVVSAEITYDARPPDPFYLRHSAEKRMAKIVNSGMFEGIEHLEFIKEEFACVSDVLLGLIDGLHIDLIVLGMHGRGGIKKLVLGSVAEEIVNSAPCPVLTVGPQVAPKMISELKLKKILCATDLRPGSARVLSCAQALAKDENSHLTLVHVLNIPADAPPERREAQKNIAMDQLLQLLLLETGPSVEAEPLVEIGAPQERIPKVAEDLHADVIVMGPHHTFHPRISAHLPWAMLHHVLSRARCPVLRV